MDMMQQVDVPRSAGKEFAQANAAVVSASKDFFPTIDVLRAFAAFSVVMFHIIGYNQWTGFYRYPGYLLRQGWLGVDLFFVISGFVISLSLFTLFDSGRPYHLLQTGTSRRARHPANRLRHNQQGTSILLQ